MNSFFYEWHRSKTRFDTESKSNSEMGYSSKNFKGYTDYLWKRRLRRHRQERMMEKSARGKRAAKNNLKTVRPVWISSAAYTL